MLLTGMILSRAGNKVSEITRPINIPTPEMMPNSDTPTKSVGIKAKKPIDVVKAHKNMETPMVLMVLIMAVSFGAP